MVIIRKMVMLLQCIVKMPLLLGLLLKVGVTKVEPLVQVVAILPALQVVVWQAQQEVDLSVQFPVIKLV